ncbi:MAG: TatD family deoxyribonuclease [Planctomycetes bacterium]|nr:TatD family deoxyribonuclease [Planctomycetota bacterium]
MQAYDTHCHLGFHGAPGAEQEHARALQAGVVAMLTVGTDASSSARARELGRLPGVRWSAGLHPNDARRFAAEWPAVAALARSPGCAAIGETGLDTYRDRTPLDQQQAALHAHLELANELGLPVILHCREAFAPLFAVLQQAPPRSGVMHCFSGGLDEARRALDLGLCVSFAGPLTYPKNDALRAVARFVPDAALLVETDAPFLPPQAFRGQRNEPAFVVHTLQALADARGISLEAAAELTSGNALRLFG